MKLIRLLSLILACALVFAVTAVFAFAEDSYIIGDADGDGLITVIDVTTIQRYLSDIPVPNFNEDAADVNGSGLDISDATFIQRYLAEMEVPHDIGGTQTRPTEAPPTVKPTQTENYELPFVPV